MIVSGYFEIAYYSMKKFANNLSCQEICVNSLLVFIMKFAAIDILERLNL